MLSEDSGEPRAPIVVGGPIVSALIKFGSFRFLAFRLKILLMLLPENHLLKMED